MSPSDIPEPAVSPVSDSASGLASPEESPDETACEWGCRRPATRVREADGAAFCDRCWDDYAEPRPCANHEDGCTDTVLWRRSGNRLCATCLSLAEALVTEINAGRTAVNLYELVNYLMHNRVGLSGVVWCRECRKLQAGDARHEVPRQRKGRCRPCHDLSRESWRDYRETLQPAA